MGKQGVSERRASKRRAWRRLTTLYAPRSTLHALLVLLLASCTPKKTQTLLQPAEALGTVLADEAVRAAGSKKQILLIAPDANWGSPSTVEKAFRSEVKREGASVVTSQVNVGDPMRSGE